MRRWNRVVERQEAGFRICEAEMWGREVGVGVVWVSGDIY